MVRSLATRGVPDTSYDNPKSILSPFYVGSMSVLSSKAGENGRKAGQILDVQHAKKKTWFKTAGYAPPVTMQRCFHLSLWPRLSHKWGSQP
jgi:hypothetical protein